MYNTVFTEERLIVLANKLKNSLSSMKRDASSMMTCVWKKLLYQEDSHLIQSGFYFQEDFLTDVIKKIDNNEGIVIIENLEKLRKIIMNPENFNIYIASNLDIVENPVEPLRQLFPDRRQCNSRIDVCPDYKLHKNNASQVATIVGVGSVESSYLIQSINSIKSHSDPDLLPLKLFLQYLTQTEGPLWKTVRGKGYAYSFNIMPSETQGILTLVLAPATDVVGAYKETKNVVLGHIQDKTWDETLLESAKSSLIFSLVNTETSVAGLIDLSLFSYFYGVDFTHNRNMLKMLDQISIDDLNRVGEKYVAPLFATPEITATVIITDPAKSKEIADDFKQFNISFDVYNSVDEFLSRN